MTPIHAELPPPIEQKNYNSDANNVGTMNGVLKDSITATTPMEPGNGLADSESAPDDKPSTRVTQTTDDKSFDERKSGEDGEQSTEEQTMKESQHIGNTDQEKPTPDTSPSLVCPANDRDHEQLLKFGIDDCPLCNQSLRALKSQLAENSQADGAESDAHGSEDPEAEADHESETEAKQTNMSYVVEYQDVGGYIITTENWPGPFELQDARAGAGSVRYKSKDVSFQVLTVLQTSIPSDSSRYGSEVDEIMERGILKNPEIAVSVHHIQLKIQSWPFLNVLKSVLSYDPDSSLESEVIRLNEPFSSIAHHINELKDHRSTLQQQTTDGQADEDIDSHRLLQEETIEHLDIVLNFMDDFFSDRIRNELALHAKTPALCTFRMLWLLYKPGSTVYVKTDGIWDAFVILSVDVGDAVLSCSFEQLSNCKINLWYLDFDGQYVGRRKTSTVIQPFSGEKSILSLEVVPNNIWDSQDGGELRKTLEDEGEQWYGLLTGDQVFYDGQTIGQKYKPLKGRVFADTAAYCESEEKKLFDPILDASSGGKNRHISGTLAGCTCSDCKTKRETAHKESFLEAAENKPRWHNYDKIDPKDVKSLEDKDSGDSSRHRYLLCSRYLEGFVFKTRKWETLNVSHCHKPKLNRLPLKNLVMPDERKKMIQALVYKYTDPRFKSAGEDSQVWGADFIENKGEGQIFLLHGGPGVGKTFTAECIAEFTGRPLLALTCGDLGTDEKSIETSLNKWLGLAHRWGAVMLIDEADVFLEKRQEADIKRNSLVSVFLREIEYYRGILFLTTNRVGQFDGAFISRIHVVLHYPDLNAKDRRRIWNQFFDKLQAERGKTIKVTPDAKRYVLEEAKLQWNGREIRNAFQTAVALADYNFISKMDKEEDEIAELEAANFEQVCNMTVKFKDYLTEVNQGEDEHQRASKAKERLAPSENQDENS